MDNAYQVVGGLCKLAVGKIYRVVNLAGFDVVDKLNCSHVSAVILRFRGGCAEVRNGGYAVYPDNLVGREVGDVCRNLAGSKCRDYISGVYKLSSGEVEDPYTILHLGQGIRTNSVFGFGVAGKVECQIISLSINLGQGLNNLYSRLQAQSGGY